MDLTLYNPSRIEELLFNKEDGVALKRSKRYCGVTITGMLL